MALIPRYAQHFKVVLNSEQNNDVNYTNGEFKFYPQLPMFLKNDGKWCFDIESLSIEDQNIINALGVFSVPSLRQNGLLAYYEFKNGSDLALDSSGYQRHGTVNVPLNSARMVFTPEFNGCLKSVFNGIVNGNDTNSAFLNFSNHINVFKNTDTMTVSFNFFYTNGANSNLFTFSKDANTYWRIRAFASSGRMRIGFDVVMDGITILSVRTNEIRGAFLHVVVSSSPTGNALFVNGQQITIYTTGNASTGIDFSSLDVNFATIGIQLGTPTTASMGGDRPFLGLLANFAIFNKFADATIIQQTNSHINRKFANLHIKELLQVVSYNSNKRGTGDAVLTFNTENTQQLITKKTTGHPLSQLVDFVHTPLTVFFTNENLNKVDVPNGAFQVVIKFWRVD